VPITEPAEHSQHTGHHGGHAHHVEQFRALFWCMLALAVPTVLLSPMFAMIVGYRIPQLGAITWISPSLGTVMYFWGGRPFLTGAIGEIRSRKAGMMLLIGLAITVAFVSSCGASLGVLDHQLDFWWELALLIVIMLLGHWIEMRSLAQTSSALESLAALLPDEAERVEGDQLVTVPPAHLQVRDVVLVRPGGRVPADGRIVDGAADMDESMITGESRTVPRAVGDTVVAGTVATDSAVRVQVSAVGDDTALAGIQRMVAEEVGVDRFFAGARPEEKAARVSELQAEGHTVAMVGDGVSDAPVLALSTVIVALNAQLLRRMDLRPAPRVG
jgi:Cu2+-exporting ATPase